MKTLKMVAAAALMIAATIFGVANAQDRSQQQDAWNGWMGMMGPRGMMGYGGPGSWMMGQGDVSQAMCNVMANHIEGRLAYIKVELKITDAQESPWNAYAAAARDNANAMRAHCTTMMNRRSGLSLPDRLEQHEQLMAVQLDAIRAMNKTPLYAELDEKSKESRRPALLGTYGLDVIELGSVVTTKWLHR